MKFLTVHGHFYQPPRENPWLEAVEVEEGAAPYHNWNERITAECYAPNAANLDAKILEADRVSRQRGGGHGNAIAQAYNHLIMPLASRRDKVTQVRWGIEDFRHRFGRDPEGMWLPETATDRETLAVLAQAGLKFTILAPTQARRVRPLPDGRWQSVEGGKIDPSRAYRWASGADPSLALFFYDSPISRAIAFEGALADGETLRARQRWDCGSSSTRPRPRRRRPSSRASLPKRTSNDARRRGARRDAGGAAAELVERKGLGHPDTLSDSLVEAISLGLNRMYLERAGSICHYNIDKALLVAGQCVKGFGWGELTQPIELILGDRATFTVNGRRLPVEETARLAVDGWVAAHLPHVRAGKDLKTRIALAAGSEELPATLRSPPPRRSSSRWSAS